MSKSVIVYYSQMGNTQKIAYAINQGLRHVFKQCDIFRLREIQPQNLSEYDLIGLGSPVWNGRASVNMEAFINKLPPLEGKQAFFFCTHGTLPGAIFLNTLPALQSKKLAVIGWHNWYGSCSLPYYPKPYWTDGHPDAIDIKEAEDFGIHIGERSLKIFGGASGLIPELPQGKEYEEIYGKSASAVFPDELQRLRFIEFQVDEKRCTGCRLCADNCPTNNIDFPGSLPVFKTQYCRRCWYCEQICPTGAIEYDWEPYLQAMRKFSNAQEREKILSAAEAKGLFRRLVPIEAVNWDTPWYKVSKHPRLRVP